MMRLKFYLIFLIVAVPLLCRAQYKLASDPAQFVVDVSTMLNTTNNQGVMIVASNFNSSWAGFSDDQKKKIIETCQKMLKSKKLRTNPNFSDFFATLVASKNANLSGSNLDTLLAITQYAVEKYDGQKLNTYFSTIRLVVEKGMVYSSGYNRLYFKGGSYNFRLVKAKEEASVIDQYDQLLAKEEQQDQAQTQTTDDGWGNAKDMDKKKKEFFSDWDNPEAEENSWGTLDESQAKPEDQNIYNIGYVPTPQPPIDGAVIEFKDVDFIFVTASDSTALKGTSGSLMLKNNLFVGNGGKFDWTMAGFGPDEITAELKEYNFPVKSTKLVCESAVLTYPAKTDNKVEGIFEFNSKKHKTFEDNQYPRFKSYGSNIEIKGLGENIKYKGGLSLAGRKMYSSSIDEGTASIEILHEGKTRIRSVSPRFTMTDSTITSDVSSIVLYQTETDSIFHPGGSLKYNKNSATVRITKPNGYRHSPFLDSYHKIEIVADALSWNLAGSQIDFNITNGRDQIPALFESEEYFSGDKYSGMQGMYKFHPLQMIVAHADKTKSDVMFAEDVAKAYKLEPLTVRGAMVQLMKTGFIDYNVKAGEIKLRRKARHYVLSRRDKKDYDNITFVSISPGGANATLDLNSNELLVRGVDKIYISDSLNVNFVPDKRELKILKNRDFSFHGKINTQNFQFIGNDFNFVYDSFLVHLKTIDQIRLAVESKEKTEKGKARVLGNELRYSSGTLYINKPDNKSGRKRIPAYPIFDATSGATVFFDKPTIANGAYDTTIKFKIPPFKIDSLSSDDPQAIGFDGSFETGGIFPEFNEKLIVMPDYSLGFVHDAPKNGYQLYNGTGTYYNRISLDNKGIRGDGDITYLNAVLKSKDFAFFKDSVLTEGTSVVNKEGGCAQASSQDVLYPDMMVNDYRLKWLPKADSMFISNAKDPIKFYKGTGDMHGTAILTKNGMFGKGVLITRGSESESPKFHFEQTKFAARETLFKVKSDNPDKPALKCEQVKLNFDLDQSIAQFSPEQQGFASNEFPYAQYKTSLDEGTWDLKKKKIFMKMPEDGNINKSYFYSTRADQDSLVFNATDAVYDMEKLTLNVFGIPYIKVADGLVYPDSSKVIVEENAVMRTLKNARIVLDSVTKYHHLYDGIIDIEGRKKFAGEATYQYVNLGADTLSFKFQDFRLVESEKKKEGAHTVAMGAIREEDSLEVAPKILYKGKVTLFAEKKFLAFDGFLKLDLKGALSYSQWLKYNNDGSNGDVVINVDNAVAGNGTPLTTGMYFDTRSNEMYTTFISQKRNQLDHDIFSTKGVLEYIAQKGLFRVGVPDRLAGKTKQGSIFSYDDANSTSEFSGKFNILKENKNITLDAAGFGKSDLTNFKYEFNTILSFNFKVNSSVLAAVGKNLKTMASAFPLDTSETSEKIFARDTVLVYKLAELIGNAGAEKFKSQKSLGYAPLPMIDSDFGKNVVFSDVNLKWSAEYKAFYSVGTIYVSNILKDDINKAMPGHIEIKKTPKGDVINIYLEASPHSWYYITYDDNRFAVTSSNDEVNSILAGKSKGELPDRSKFYYVKAENGEKTRFVTMFKERYLGVQEDLDEDIPESQEYEEEGGAEEELQEEAPADEIPGVGEEVEEETPAKKTSKPAKKGKEDTRNYDKYKLPDQNLDQGGEDPAGGSKPDPSMEDRKKQQQDQQKMKNLFGN